MKIIRRTPKSVNQPVGEYAHITKIPAGMDTYVLSGQIGVQEDGTIPTSFEAEITQMFMNIKDVLRTENLTHENVTKVNIWSVEEIDWDFFYKEWNTFFEGNYPSMTIAYIKALGLPEIKIEIDIWAAK